MIYYTAEDVRKRSEETGEGMVTAKERIEKKLVLDLILEMPGRDPSMHLSIIMFILRWLVEKSR